MITKKEVLRMGRQRNRKSVLRGMRKKGSTFLGKKKNHSKSQKGGRAQREPRPARGKGKQATELSTKPKKRGERGDGNVSRRNSVKANVEDKGEEKV